MITQPGPGGPSSCRRRSFVACLAIPAILLSTQVASAVSSGELYTSAAYTYGRFEARIQFAGGDGVVSSFFLWKDASEMADVFWNELDLETIWADCELKTNALYGLPEANHTASSGTAGGWCTGFHTYAFEWTPDYVAWFADGTELRRETGADSTAFRDNAAEGMQLHFNTWPGDSTFGGNFTEAILPVHEYINWVQYSSYDNGTFQLEWREDFTVEGSLPEGWLAGTWGSPKNLSTHTEENVTVVGGFAVISLTTDDATGFAGTLPTDIDNEMPVTGSGGAPAGGSGAMGGQGPVQAGAGGAAAGASGTGTAGAVATMMPPTGGAGAPQTDPTQGPTGTTGTTTGAAGDSTTGSGAPASTGTGTVPAADTTGGGAVTGGATGGQEVTSGGTPAPGAAATPSGSNDGTPGEVMSFESGGSGCTLGTGRRVAGHHWLVIALAAVASIRRRALER